MRGTPRAAPAAAPCRTSPSLTRRSSRAAAARAAWGSSRRCAHALRECDWGPSPNRLAWLARAARAFSGTGSRSPRDLRRPGTGDKAGNPVADCSGDGRVATELATEKPPNEELPSLALVGPPGWPLSVAHAAKAPFAQKAVVRVRPDPAPVAMPPAGGSQ